MRTLLYGLLALVVLAVAGVLVAPSLIDWNPFKRDLALEVKAVTGRDVEIAGDLDFALLPSPHLVAEGVRLANLPGAATPDMARIKSLRVDVRFWPLLAGRIEVETMRLIEPAIALERLANGKVNWDFSAPPSIGGASRETGMAFAVDRVIVENGTVAWRDAATNRTESVEKVNAEIIANALAGPFKISGKLVARGTPATVEASMGALDGGKPVTVVARIGLGGLALEFAGTLADLDTKPRLEGSLKGSAENFARAVELSDAPRALAAKLAFTGALKATRERAALDGVEIELGDVRGRGTVGIAFGDTPRIEATLAVTRLALAPWLESSAPASKAKFALPANISGAFDLTVRLVEAKPGPIRDVEISAALDGGALRIDRAAAQLPGGTSVVLGGTLVAKDGKPDFDFAVEMQTVRLRGLLEAAGLDVSQVAGDRLLTASGAAKLTGGFDKFHILGIDARIDGARVTGGIAVALDVRTGFGASLAADSLDLDAYLPRGDSDAAKSSARFWNGFDANLRARLGALTWRATQLDGVKLDLTLRDGELTVHEVSARDVGGAALALAGKLTDFDAPKLVLDRIEAKLDDVPVTGTGRIDFSGAKPMIVAKLVAGDIVFAANEGPPTGNWSRDKVDFSALDAFDADLTIDAAAVAWRSWKVDKPHASASIKDGTLDVTELTGKLFGGGFRLTGRVETGEQPLIAVKLRVDGANVAEALFSTGPGGLDITGGTMDVSADLAARGDSPFAIVSTIGGTAELAVRDGTVKGFDLPAVSRRLMEVNDPFDLLSLGDLFSAGESQFASLRGSFKAEGGAVWSGDLTLVAPAGAGSASAVADLPRWLLEAKAEFLLTELKDSPPVTVRFEGPLDDPSAIVQSDDLRQWVVRRGLGQKDQKKPPPVAAKPAPAPEAKPAAPEPPPPAEAKRAAPEPPPQPAPKPDGKALTKGLLDGLRP